MIQVWRETSRWPAGLSVSGERGKEIRLRATFCKEFEFEGDFAF